ncbi:hypothetical protein EBT31_03840 [bacterium]|nr:hypothetical protein [bacterium]NBX48754.1 hypothetical protein [bacterium]
MFLPWNNGPGPAGKQLTPQQRNLFKKLVARRRNLKQARNTRRRRAYTMSSLQTLLFNATAHTDDVDVVQLFSKLAESKPAGFLSASLKGGQFKELARINSKGVIPFKPSAYKPNHVMILFELGGKRNIVNVFSNGSLRLSGASDISDVVRFTEKLVGSVEDVIISNTSGQLRINKNIALDAMYEHFPKEILKGGGRLSYETDPDLRTPGLSFKYSAKFTRQVPSANQGPAKVPVEKAITEAIFGRKTKMETEEYYEKFFAITFYRTGAIQFKGKVADVGAMISFIRGILDAVQQWALVPKLVEETPAVKKERKYSTRSSNPPNPPDSFEGQCAPGYYCRPNAQGFPTCYKIPVINESSRRTVTASYKAAGVPIPEKVRKLFGIDEAPAGEYGIKLTLERQKFQGKTIEVLKVGGRQCYRMSEDQLEDVARKLGIPGIRKGMGIAKMCGRLKQTLHVTNKRFNKSNFTLNGVPYYIVGNSIKGAQRANGKPNPPRKCATLPVAVLQKYARAYGIDPTGKSRPKICAEMMAKKNAEPKNLGLPSLPLPAPAPAPKPASVPESVSISRAEAHFRKSMGNVPFSNKNVAEYLATAPGYRRAYFISQLKQANALRKSIRLNDIPEASRNTFLNSVMVFSRTKKYGGKFPSRAEVLEFRNRQAERFRRLLARPYNRTGPGGATANVEVM